MPSWSLDKVKEGKTRPFFNTAEPEMANYPPDCTPPASPEALPKNLDYEPHPLDISQRVVLAAGSAGLYGNFSGSSPSGTLVCDVLNRDVVYPFGTVVGLFVGLEDRVRPPEDEWARWKAEVEPRLWTDVRAFQNKTKKVKRGRTIVPGLALELRMSGYLVKETGKVTLQPRIWILYDESRWKKDVHRFVSEMDWLQFAGFGPPEVHRGCPRMASLETVVPFDMLELTKSQAIQEIGDYELYLHIEEPSPKNASACGLSCCATLTKGGRLVSQRISRLGGLLWVDGDASGVTTAHGLVEQFLSEFTDEDADMSDSDSDCSSDQDSGTVANSERVWQANIGCFDPSQIRAWRDVQACDAAGFLGLSTPNLSSMLQWHHWSSITEPSAHSSKSDSSGLTDLVGGPSQPANDFALLEVPNYGNFEELRNHYLHPCLGKVEVSSVPDFYPDIPAPGTVHLVFRSGAVDGSLSPSSSRFSLHGFEFHTRKVRLSAPLAQGCSGTWVVDKNQLLGMIIASYPDEPYAHMITSTQLLLDIRAATPEITSVKLSAETRAALSTATRNTRNMREATPPSDFGIFKADMPTWNVPPLGSPITLGVLQYSDGSRIGFDINGTIDKGFFLADGEWACYRRNYFSCTVSYALSDLRPRGLLRHVDSRTREEFDVFGFAVSISAVTADNDQCAIPLLQHIRGCDSQGIAQKPSIVVGIVRLAPRREHAFERVQFKLATANNGKRRAAQQYYQLVVELWADVGLQNETGFVKIGQRKSANLIVRGRSPGHYQSERRG